MTPSISINNLSFSYSDQSEPCLNNINLTVQEGERFGLFGPNGAGKSTLLLLLTGLISYTKGSVQLMGSELQQNLKSLKKNFGFVPQDFSFYQELSPKENLEFFGAWYGLSKQEIQLRSEELLQILNLSEVKNKTVSKFSGGMKRRVNLAIGVIHQPKLLFLDEPTVGVDIQSRHAIIDYLKNLNKNGTTLIYTSHQLSEAEDLCDSVAFIDHGKIIERDTLAHLKQKNQDKSLDQLFIDLTGKAIRD